MVHLITYQFATCYAPPPKNLSLRGSSQLNTKLHQGQIRSKLLQNFGQQGRLFETCNMLVKLLDSGHVLKVRIGHEVPARREHYKIYEIYILC
jgi:hypothetical protein